MVQDGRGADQQLTKVVPEVLLIFLLISPAAWLAKRQDDIAAGDPRALNNHLRLVSLEPLIFKAQATC